MRRNLEPEILLSHSEQETKEIGEKIAKKLKEGDVIALNGDLGAGKTAFAKGIAKGLGIKEFITSPTFTIVNEYIGKIPLYHFDVYRINHISEMDEIGTEEYLYGEGVCVIEWADLIKDLLPEHTVDIRIFRIDDVSRRIEVRI